MNTEQSGVGAMPSDGLFRQVLENVFKQLGVTVQENTLTNDAYTVTVDGILQVHLVGKQQGFLHLWCSPCSLPENASNELLLELLAANTCGKSH